MNSIWQALAREAELSAEHMAIGVTALGRADMDRKAYYAQAFFALSVGFERSCKLALVLDHALMHAGKFPASKTVKGYRHDLDRLLLQTEKIAERMDLPTPDARLPRSDIHRGIIDTLSDFATNVTRYFNLDLITGNPRASEREDPVAAWSRNVTTPVLARHYKRRHRERHMLRARHFDMSMGPYVIVRSHAETGESIETLHDAMLQSAAVAFARPWERMYVLQIARFIGTVMSSLGYAAQGKRLEDVPYLSEFFAIFNNQDTYLRKRKVWSIHH